MYSFGGELKMISFIVSLLWIKLGLLPWPILYDQTELIKNPGRFKKLRDETNTVAGPAG